MSTMTIFAALCLLTFSTAQESTVPADETPEIPTLQPTPDGSDELVTDHSESITPTSTTRRPCRGHRHHGHHGGGFGLGPFGLFGVGDRGGFGSPGRFGNNFERGSALGFGEIRRSNGEREDGSRGGVGRGFENGFGAVAPVGFQGNGRTVRPSLHGSGNGESNDRRQGNDGWDNNGFGGFEGGDFAQERSNRQRGEFGIPVNNLPNNGEEKRDIFRGF